MESIVYLPGKNGSSQGSALSDDLHEEWVIGEERPWWYFRLQFAVRLLCALFGECQFGVPDQTPDTILKKGRKANMPTKGYLKICTAQNTNSQFDRDQIHKN